MTDSSSAKIASDYYYLIDRLYKIPITGANVHEINNILTGLRCALDSYFEYGILPESPITFLWRAQVRIVRLEKMYGEKKAS